MTNDDYERRRERRLRALGTRSPVCVCCGEDDPFCLELHHIGERKHNGDLSIVCRNCHRKLTDPQKDRSTVNNEEPFEEQLGRYLCGLADLLRLVAETLTKFGQQLLGLNETGVKRSNVMTRGEIDSIAIRAYTEKPGKKRKTKGEAKEATPALQEPSDWTLIFDTETTIDPAQSLRVGFYQLRDGDTLHEEGGFYHPSGLSDDELDCLQLFCDRHGLALRELSDFNENILLKFGSERGGTIVGFNLPFDLSRIAIHHGAARGPMRGGFSLQLVEDYHRPRIQVKHLSGRASLIQFAAPRKQRTARGARKRGIISPVWRGVFVDVSTLAAALLARKFSLEGLCRELGTATQKTASDDHGAVLSDRYLDYARQDVQATWECYAVLLDEYNQHGLDTPPHRIISEASIGKAYLKEMGIDPLLACQDVPRGLFGTIMSTFYGGRAEVVCAGNWSRRSIPTSSRCIRP